jgi:hypothetical protein
MGGGGTIEIAAVEKKVVAVVDKKGDVKDSILKTRKGIKVQTSALEEEMKVI